MSLPQNFLTQLEQYSELSHREKTVFVEIFGNGKSRVQVTQALNISQSNLSSCLTGIYNKFSISGSGPVKESRLREYLQKRYSHQKLAGSSTAEVAEADIVALVQEIREQVKTSIKEKCGTMRVLDMSQPIELTGERGIYTNVNILEKITGRRRLEIRELLQNCETDDFERFGLNRVKEERVPGLEAVQRHNKLMVLGKPGAGKTTFLKYLAIQCIEGQYLINRVPFFITLKEFAEESQQPNILEYFVEKLSFCGIQNAKEKIEQLLRYGKALVLLDGLDEVREEDTRQVLRQILEISENFYTNQFVITCRIAAKEYTFEKFTEVEVADFDKDQIVIFAQNWFRLIDPLKAERFLQKLEDNEPIYELATNPLLLTLLCLVFGESADFPTNRSELYKEGVEVLLKKWDAKRNIERDQVYKNLSLNRKVDLLSQIALATFERKEYFFKQKTVEAYIADFIYNLRDARTEPEELKLDSEAVLKSIESQHGLLVERAKGIYSFSHLTFQEYFTAREIVANSAYEIFVEHIIERRWREVFLIAVGMMRKADNLLLLMKAKIDNLIAEDEEIKKWFIWVNQKSISVKANHHLEEIQEFYINHDIGFEKHDKNDNDIKFIVDTKHYYEDIDYEDIEVTNPFIKKDFYKSWFSPIDINLLLGFYKEDDNGLLNTSIHSPDLDLDNALLSALNQAVILAESDLPKIENVNKLKYTINRSISLTDSRELQRSLRRFQQKIPNPEKDKSVFKFLWNKFGRNWVKQFRSILIDYRNIGYEWQFNNQQKLILRDYFIAKKILVDCLNSDCYVSREVRNKIDDILL
ncbi:NACHT domain family protein [Calothrix sp. NIES-2100]|uniref:NACHT domain-containing protein n=1 Tax=Calothrix sp. NIES-2100 TaxID=1954172 RepID=UPI000B5F9E27|nr:NACHT domain family protein [Calothrix sp. NIES-2100]